MRVRLPNDRQSEAATVSLQSAWETFSEKVGCHRIANSGDGRVMKVEFKVTHDEPEVRPLYLAQPCCIYHG